MRENIKTLSLQKEEQYSKWLKENGLIPNWIYLVHAARCERTLKNSSKKNRDFARNYIKKDSLLEKRLNYNYERVKK